MELRQALYFVLVAMATTLLCSVPHACSLPHGGMKRVGHKVFSDLTNSEKNDDNIDSWRNPGFEEEDVTTTSQEIMCNQKLNMPDTFRSCKTLHKVLSEHFSRPGNSQRLDTSYNAFTLADLFYSGVLEGPLNNDRMSSKQHMVRRGNEACDNLLREWLRPHNVKSGPCSWHYTCAYNPDTFPSFKVEAQIDHREFLDAERCLAVKMSYVTVFQKVACLEDPCRSAENWVEMNNQEIVVGFTAAV